MVTQITPKNNSWLTCINCDFKCSKKGDWTRHLSTAKHKKMYNVTPSDAIITSLHRCVNCAKPYKSRNGLWSHNKKCKKNEALLDQSQSQTDVSILSNLVLELVKSNNDLQKQMLEVCKNNNSTNSNNVINSHNKTFNLQFFLNEECKDAMNMSEFIKSIDLQLLDLENFAEVDYTEGMSNLIIKQLKNTDMYKRPVHCSDAKRETLYIKEENKWEKEGPENKKMIKAVRAVDKKNIDLLFQWKDEHPTCLNTDSQYNDHYLKLLRSVISGSEENVNKVIKKVSKEVVIDK